MRIALCQALCPTERLAKALQAVPTGVLPPVITGLATHASEVQKGDIFVALQGKKKHGACYAAEAFSRGAVGVLASQSDVLPNGSAALLCADPLVALQHAAATRRAACQCLIAVSGSAGKTTVKEAIAAVLSRDRSVSYSKGNFNSTLGLPLSLLSFEKSDCFVVELGISHPGEMEPMARLCAPELALLTNVGSAHVGHFRDGAHLKKEKAQIAAFLAPNGRFLIPSGLQLQDPPCSTKRIFRFGQGGDCYLEVVSNGKNGVVGDLIAADRVITNLSWPIGGEIGVSVLEAVGSVGVLMGVSDDDVRRGLVQAALQAPRMQSLFVKGGEWIDDAYNASPEAVKRALDVLKVWGRGKPTVAVLGDMLELGDSAVQHHTNLGAYVAKSDIDMLLTYGSLALHIAKGALAAGMPKEQIQSFEQEEREALKGALLSLPPGATVIIKASGGMQLSRLAREVANKL